MQKGYLDYVRVVTYEVAVGTEPTEQCTIHKMVDICTEGNCLAGEYCPPESVVQQGYLDWTREDYGESIVASDDAYLISTLEEAVAPTETSPGGCPVHTEAGTIVVDPNDPSQTIDPDDPDWPFIDHDDPTTQPEDPNGGGGTPPEEETPSGGNTGGEAQPDPTDPTGGFGDDGGDWWSGFWDNSGGT